MSKKSKIAIIGRPNVGKSTLFNRLSGKRTSIVDQVEGVTRDRIYASGEWLNKAFDIIDTGGFVSSNEDIFNDKIKEQIVEALNECDGIIFMVDGKDGLNPNDSHLAKMVRKSSKNYILAVNKCDTPDHSDRIIPFFDLGLEEPVAISALNGAGVGDILDTLFAHEDLQGKDFEDIDEESMSISIVGMPNVGKSSLTNALLQKEQTIVTPIAGTTRDSVDSLLKYYGKTITLVDTAGLRKRSKINESIEFYSTIRTQRAIEHCDVSLVLIDAEKGFSKQDKSIMDYVIKKGKGLVIIVNKWDLVEKETHTMKDFTDEIAYQFRSLAHYPILYISALTKQRVSKVLGIAQSVYETRQKKVTTAKLNQFLKKVITQQSPPATHGKVINMKYMTQVHTGPHLFVIFTNYPKLIPMSYRRFIENQLRENFDLFGVPVRVSFRRK